MVPSRWRAVAEEHFRTVHFHLTPGGGSLDTLPWKALSYVCYLAIAHCGLFSAAHTALCKTVVPLAARWGARTHPNTPLVGNVFDNTRLHMVRAGAPRTSYVVRLVRDHRVFVSRASVAAGIRRSAACEAFRALHDGIDAHNVDVAVLPWARFVHASPPLLDERLPRGSHTPPGDP